MFNPYDWYITPEEYAEAERNGISRRCLEFRVRDLAWAKQRAITTPQRVYKDRSHMKAVLMNHGISYQQFMGRLSWGWDEWSAATVPLRDVNGLREQALRMREMRRKYPRELLELAKKNGISNGLFRYRVKNGWDHTRAATMPPSPSNATMRLKELYGEDYFKELIGWVFAPGRIKRGENKKNP